MLLSYFQVFIALFSGIYCDEEVDRIDRKCRIDALSELDKYGVKSVGLMEDNCIFER